MKKVLILLSISLILLSTVIVFYYYRVNDNDSRFKKIEMELEYLRNDHDTILMEIDTLNFRLDTIGSDIRDLKKGQRFIYDEVKKSNTSFFDLFGL